MHLGPVDRKAKHAADEHDSDRTAKTPPESKTKNPQGKQTNSIPWRICKSWGGLCKEAEGTQHSKHEIYKLPTAC